MGNVTLTMKGNFYIVKDEKGKIRYRGKKKAKAESIYQSLVDSVQRRETIKRSGFFY